ncbi:sigma 54-interacting transcriptional regulator [Novosphingobium sp.]|uniref:sigma-54 interaction domain-containing protein n=1 Tax=Novosphingobium sp. TaxID=1874826 RepID=UPI0032B7453E
MTALAFSDSAARLHAPLVHRAAAIVGAAACAAAPMVRTANDPVPPGPGPCVTLERGANRLTRDGARGRFTLSYADPAGDAALAALVAALAAPGMPIAADPESLSVLALAERLAASEIPVLINGPTGTGKEVLSRFIHARSPRSAGPFVAVNCAAMPEAMLEALLFGHKRGAFTGATEASEGFFRAADGGTLLLDEIAEMPLALQAKLLRALQESEVVPIGSTQPIRVDVRVIACANRDLPTEVAEGRFRADLYYRLNVFPLALRPLRERAEDIAPLAFALVLRHGAPGKALPWIGEAALAMLRLHGWPGNVRELENVIRRALLLADGADEIAPAHIVFDSPARLVAPEGGTVVTGAAPATARLSNIVQLSEARAIMQTLDACGGSRIAAARQLGISERTLRYRLAAFREAGLATAGAAR